MEQLQQKPQKSQTWIWTTLWLTTIFDSVIIIIIISFLLEALKVFIPVSLNILIAIFSHVLALWIGAYAAVKFVVKRSIVLRSDATKLAILTIIIPTIIWLIPLISGFSKATTESMYINLFGLVLTIGFIFYSVRKLILTKGD